MTPTAALLLHGTDAEVVERLFLGLLGRFPDEMAFHHFLPRLAEHGRAGALTEVLGSEEARGRGATLREAGPCTAAEAAAALAAWRCAALRAEIAALRERPAGPGPEVWAEVAALHAALEALRAECRERLAALEEARGLRAALRRWRGQKEARPE
ncbi:hypothetical protein ACI6QG_12640 [Roseococcus sp. DSY-14]|uniref:hypothetical protein n=1 Tax=Roseococcus sp. DSY-14 TaxID=3369650 RepID=UPI00387B1FD0